METLLVQEKLYDTKLKKNTYTELSLHKIISIKITAQNTKAEKGLNL